MDTSVQKCRALCKVADTGSFTAAADALGYSQSSISRMVSDLEHSWGVQLVERTRGGVRLTEEGEALIPSVRGLCVQQDDLDTRIGELKGTVSGILRIATVSSIATHFLPPVIAAFKADYPEVTYELLIGEYTEIEAWVQSGRVDCGFTRLPVSAGLKAEALYRDELFAVMPEGHPLASKESIAPQDLCDYPFLLVSENDDVEDAGIFEGLARRPETFIATWDDYCIMSMIESGLGLSVLTGSILKRIPYRLEIRPLKSHAYRTMGFVTRGGRKAPLIVQRFSAYIQAGKPSTAEKSLLTGA